MLKINHDFLSSQCSLSIYGVQRHIISRTYQAHYSHYKKINETSALNRLYTHTHTPPPHTYIYKKSGVQWCNHSSLHWDMLPHLANFFLSFVETWVSLCCPGWSGTPASNICLPTLSKL